jgi:hypothetical protein
MAKNPVKIQYTSTVNQQRQYTMSEERQKNPVKIQYTSTVNKQRHYTMSEEWPWCNSFVYLQYWYIVSLQDFLPFFTHGVMPLFIYSTVILYLYRIFLPFFTHGVMPLFIYSTGILYLHRIFCHSSLMV